MRTQSSYALASRALAAWPGRLPIVIASIRRARARIVANHRLACIVIAPSGAVAHRLSPIAHHRTRRRRSSSSYRAPDIVIIIPSSRPSSCHRHRIASSSPSPVIVNRRGVGQPDKPVNKQQQQQPTPYHGPIPAHTRQIVPVAPSSSSSPTDTFTVPYRNLTVRLHLTCTIH